LRGRGREREHKGEQKRMEHGQGRKEWRVERKESI